jgi:hypothetical protein
MAPILALHIPLGIDIAELQAHALPFLRQKAVPGILADAEHQHPAEFGGKFEGDVFAVGTAQNPQPAALIGPGSRKPHQYRNDFVF